MSTVITWNVARLLDDPKYGPEHVAACEYGTVDEPICIVAHVIAEREGLL